MRKITVENENPKPVLATIVTAVLFALIFYSIYRAGTAMQWGGVEFDKPALGGRYFQNHDMLLLETDYPTAVKAMSAGVVTKVTERTMRTEYDNRVLIYNGFAPADGITVGKTLKKGDVIGKLVFAPDHLHAEMRVQHLFKGQVVPLGSEFKPRFKSLGEEVAIRICRGCHIMYGINPLDHGRLKGTDRLATPSDIARIIREGIPQTGELPGMPAYGESLMDTWIDASAKFTYDARVAPYVKAE